MFDEQQHPLPCRFQLVRDSRYLCDVVWYRDILATSPSKNRKIPRRGQVGTEQPPATNLQFDAQQRVLNLDAGVARQLAKVILACARLQDTVAVDARQPTLSECCLQRRS